MPKLFSWVRDRLTTAFAPSRREQINSAVKPRTAAIRELSKSGEDDSAGADSLRARGSDAAVPDKAERSAAAAVKGPTRSTEKKPSNSRAAPAKRPAAPAQVDVVIGVDWGTSTTKVIARAPYVAGRRCVPLALGVARHRSADKYLLPSILYLKDGNGRLEQTIGAHELRDIKVRTLDYLRAPDGDETPFHEATAFLALVLARARAVAATHALLGAGQTVRWWVNLGVPAKGFDDEVLGRHFSWAARAASRLGRQVNGAVSLRRARDSYEEVKRGNQPDSEEGRVAVFPEFAAGIAGYTYGESRELGLHFIVDVGASTLDVAGFVLFEVENEYRYQILEAEVARLGAFELHRARLQALNALGAPVLPSVASDGDPQAIVPASVGSYCPGSYVETIDREFVDKCERLITAVCMRVRRDRYKIARNWSNGVKMFVCGGAGVHPIYRDAIRQTDTTLQKSTTIAPMRLQLLPVSGGLRKADITDADARFFAVAEGLSLPAAEIGIVQPARDAPDIRDSTPILDAHFVDKDQV